MSKNTKPHPEDYCHKCNGKNITWYASNELWNAVMPDNQRGEILCPICFVKLAEERGLKPCAWRISLGEQ